MADANSYLIAAAAKDAGADARRYGIVADDHSALLDVLESQLLRADLLITTGGVTMGAFDVVKQALTELGTVEFTRVAMQPGKPQGFGHLGNKVPIFCLPGNPVSALVSFEVFVRPAIRKLLGKRTCSGPRCRRRRSSASRARPGSASTGAACCTARRPAATASRWSAAPGSHLIASMAVVQLPGRHRRGGHRGRRRLAGHRHPAAARRTGEHGAHPGWPATLPAGPVLLRPPRLRDGRAWSEVRLRNQTWLEPWEPSSPYPWAERNAAGCLAAAALGAASGPRGPARCCRSWCCYGGRLAGQINVSNVVHGVQRSCTIGYWVDGALAGRGIMPTALALVIDHCFAAVGLHRVEIDIRPENAASLRVVEKLGLRREGYFERYLDIDGGWRDHVGFAMTVEELGGATMLSRLSALPAAAGVAAERA